MTKLNLPYTAIQRAHAGILGALLGDALGVPHEFKPADQIPVADQIELEMPSTYRRSHPSVPYGCWSDDGSQLLCLLDALHGTGGTFEPDSLALQLLAWWRDARHQSGGRIFDCGSATRRALDRLGAGTPPLEAGVDGARSQGNGSLMRVLPVVLMPLYWGRTPEDAIAAALAQSRLTHAHPVPRICCALYAQLALIWLAQPDLQPGVAVQMAFLQVRRHLTDEDRESHQALSSIRRFGESELPTGSGFVVDSLWTALWALERGRDYLSTVRLAISLGQDTDTSACVAGGLAAIRWGFDARTATWAGRLHMPDESRRLLQSVFCDDSFDDKLVSRNLRGTGGCSESVAQIDEPSTAGRGETPHELAAKDRPVAVVNNHRRLLACMQRVHWA